MLKFFRKDKRFVDLNVLQHQSFYVLVTLKKKEEEV